MAFKIRTLSIQEYEKIIGVWKRADLSFRPSGRDSRENIVKQMALDQEMFLGCFVGNELAGVVIGSYDSRKGWINRLAVVPEHRRKGIAKALVRKIEETLKARGFRIIGVLIEHDSEESMKLFSKAGYVKHDDIYYYTKREDKEV